MTIRLDDFAAAERQDELIVLMRRKIEQFGEEGVDRALNGLQVRGIGFIDTAETYPTGTKSRFDGLTVEVE